MNCSLVHLFRESIREGGKKRKKEKKRDEFEGRKAKEERNWIISNLSGFFFCYVVCSVKYCFVFVVLSQKKNLPCSKYKKKSSVSFGK